MPAVLTGDVASVLSDAHVDAGGTQARGCSGGRAGLPVGHTVPALWRMHSGRRGEGSLPAAPRGLSPGAACDRGERGPMLWPAGGRVVSAWPHRGLQKGLRAV